jgi:hypothetical protein
MRDELKEAIETHLLTAGGSGWVKSIALCALFEIKDRQLRAVGNRPGLASEFAISGDKGFKHIDRATPREYLRFKHRMRRHAIGQLVRARQLDRRRNQTIRTIKRPAFTFQKDSGQGVLL